MFSGMHALRARSMSFPSLTRRLCMNDRTTLAPRLRNGFAALTMCLVLLTGATLAWADRYDTVQDTDLDHQLRRIGHIIVIYQENWSFDALYGQFPGADGLQNG